MSKQQKKEARKKARQLEQEQQAKKEATRNTIKKILIAAIAIVGIFIFFAKRTYIGYFLGAIALPYGIYGMIFPYKSAIEYAKKGYEMVYSRQFGTLMMSLGVLGIIYSRLLPEMNGNKLFLIAMLLYMMMFFFVMSLLQKRYMKPPEADPDALTLEEMAQMAKTAKAEAKAAKKEQKEQEKNQ